MVAERLAIINTLLRNGHYWSSSENDNNANNAWNQNFDNGNQNNNNRNNDNYIRPWGFCYAGAGRPALFLFK